MSTSSSQPAEDCTESNEKLYLILSLVSEMADSLANSGRLLDRISRELYYWSKVTTSTAGKAAPNSTVSSSPSNSNTE